MTAIRCSSTAANTAAWLRKSFGIYPNKKSPGEKPGPHNFPRAPLAAHHSRGRTDLVSDKIRNGCYVIALLQGQFPDSTSLVNRRAPKEKNEHLPRVYFLSDKHPCDGGWQ